VDGSENVASRLEQMFKGMEGETDFIVLVSGNSVALVKDHPGLTNQRRRNIPGRDGDIDIWTLT